MMPGPLGINWSQKHARALPPQKEEGQHFMGHDSLQSD